MAEHGKVPKKMQKNEQKIVGGLILYSVGVKKFESLKRLEKAKFRWTTKSASAKTVGGLNKKVGGLNIKMG
jgi:hypothetical protein